MPNLPEPYFIKFEPALQFRSSRYYSAWEVLTEMGLRQTVAFQLLNMDITGLTFDSREEALMFKLKLL